MSVFEEDGIRCMVIPGEFLDPLPVSEEELFGRDVASAAAHPESYGSKGGEGPVGEKIEEEGRGMR